MHPQPSYRAILLLLLTFLGDEAGFEAEVRVQHTLLQQIQSFLTHRERVIFTSCWSIFGSWWSIFSTWWSVFASWWSIIVGEMTGKDGKSQEGGREEREERVVGRARNLAFSLNLCVKETVENPL